MNNHFASSKKNISSFEKLCVFHRFVVVNFLKTTKKQHVCIHCSSQNILGRTKPMQSTLRRSLNSAGVFYAFHFVDISIDT